jgi:putative ABC transport system permease protein
LQQVLSQSADEQRFRTVLMGAFGACALVLALVGIYGVFSNFVALRTNEIGLRLALGAQRTDVLKLVLGHALKLTGIGVAIGVAGSLALNHALANQLVNVRPADFVTLIGVSVMLTGAALAACFIPARRAANIDPMTALRHE